MHHLVSIMVIALCHMHHFGRAWNPSSSCCTIIVIIHLSSASCSWLYIEHCTRSRAFCHYPLIASVWIDMFYNQSHPNHSGNKLWARMFQTSFIKLSCYPHLLSMSFVMNVTDIYHPHDCDLNSIKTWSPFPLLSCHTPMIFTTNINLLRYDCFLLLLMGNLLLFPLEPYVRISGRDSF
jgi:hypothetical protein